MAYGMDDRVREQGTHAGTGAVTLPNSAVSGFQTFLSGWGASGTGEYTIVIGPQWETGFGTLNAGGTQLTRTTVYDGSSGAGVAVNFSSGTADIFGSVPAELAHFLNMREITVASASTCDIGAVRGSVIEISGTTTITSLGSSKNRRRTVRFSGALTLTHNATSLILPGGGNITTVAGDTAEFVSDNSGNWRCLRYNYASLPPITGAAWTTFSPTFSAVAGTLTTVSIDEAKYFRVGKFYVWRVRALFTNIGTATTRLIMTLPVNVTPVNGGGVCGFNETTFKGLSGIAVYDQQNKASIVYSGDGSFPVANGQRLAISGFLEAD